MLLLCVLPSPRGSLYTPLRPSLTLGHFLLQEWDSWETSSWYWQGPEVTGAVALGSVFSWLLHLEQALLWCCCSSKKQGHASVVGRRARDVGEGRMEKLCGTADFWGLTIHRGS